MVIACTLVKTLTAYGVEVRTAQMVQTQLGGTVAVVVPYQQQSERAWRSALDALAEDHAVVALTVGQDGSPAVTGTPPDLAVLDLQAGQTSALPAWATYVTSGLGAPAVHAGTVSATGEAITLVVGNRDGTPIDLESLRHRIGHTTVPQWQAEFPGDTWLTGAAIEANQARWVLWFGTIALTISLVALWANYVNELLRVIRSLQAVQLLAPSGRFVRTVVGWRVFAPVVAAAVGGTALALILSIPPAGAGRLDLPYGFVATSAVAIAASGVVAWRLTSRAATAAARSFTLAIPDE